MSEEKKTCTRCSGSGQIPCPGCGGSGKLQQINEGKKEGFSKIVSCAGCSGRGNVTCGVCGGSGQK
jgi:DnaJ-class molecular chaperone